MKDMNIKMPKAQGTLRLTERDSHTHFNQTFRRQREFCEQQERNELS